MSAAKKKTAAQKPAPKADAPKVEAAKPVETITAFKGFDLNMQCRGYKFKVGDTFTHTGPVAACESGFHSCENPLDVWGYYPPGDGNLFAEVEASGQIARHADDSKIASGTLRIKAAITLPDFIARAIAFVTATCDPTKAAHSKGNSSASSATGDSSASSATGDSSASSATGNSSASSATGDSSASSATGYRSASSATGNSSASSATGNSSASSATGNSSASSATGYRSASSATGYRSASSATGNSSASSATGNSSASSATGYRSASSATGIAAVALNIGRYGRARASKDGAIVLCEHDDDGKLLHIRASKVGENGIEPDTYYTLTGGEFVKAAA